MMSIILWKNEDKFIDHIRHNRKSNMKLIFIKKYYEYEQFLDFIPTCLKHIIMLYTDDLIIINYSISNMNINLKPESDNWTWSHDRIIQNKILSILRNK